jgi:hypothetical protein
MKIIYLDQNKWIDLLKSIVKPKEYPKYIDIANLIQNKANSGEWIFPLSLIHFMETLSRADIGSREELAYVMSSISKNWSIKSCADVIEDEFLNSFAEIHDVTKKVEIKAVCNNLLSAIGVEHFEIQCQDHVPKAMKEDSKELIKNTTNNEKLFTLFMTYTNKPELIASFQCGDEESKREWQILRTKVAKFPKKNRYESFLLMMFLGEFSIVNKQLQEFFKKTNEEIIPTKLLCDKNKTISFLESIPSLNVTTKILYEILKDPNRPIHIHDNRDLTFLSTAIPYCDVVVTEKTWKHSVKLHKLDSNYSTTIENDLNCLLTL